MISVSQNPLLNFFVLLGNLKFKFKNPNPDSPIECTLNQDNEHCNKLTMAEVAATSIISYFMYLNNIVTELQWCQKRHQFRKCCPQSPFQRIPVLWWDVKWGRQVRVQCTESCCQHLKWYELVSGIQSNWMFFWWEFCNVAVQRSNIDWQFAHCNLQLSIQICSSKFPSSGFHFAV